MNINKNIVKDYFLRLSLNQKLVTIMLILSLTLTSVLLFMYYQAEKAIYKEFESQIAELSSGIQVGVEEVTSSGLTDEKRL